MQLKRLYRFRRSRRHCSLDSDHGKASPLQKRCWPHCGMHSAAMRFAGNRMLKKSLFSPARPRRAETRLFPCGVLASLRGSTRSRRFEEGGNTGRAFPFAKTQCKGERPPRSAVRTSSPLRSLRPCLRNGASWRAGAGRVRTVAFLSILKIFGHQRQKENSNGVLCINRVFPQPGKA